MQEFLFKIEFVPKVEKERAKLDEHFLIEKQFVRLKYFRKIKIIIMNPLR